MRYAPHLLAAVVEHGGLSCGVAVARGNLQLHGVQAVAHAVVKLARQPFALVLQSVHILLHEPAVGVGLQPAKLLGLHARLAPLLHDVDHGQGSQHRHNEQSRADIHARLGQLGLLLRQLEFLLLGLIFHGKLAHALGLLALKQAVLQGHGLGHGSVGLLPLSQACVGLVHVVVAVVHHEGHLLYALDCQNLLEQRQRPAPVFMV